MNCFIFFNDGFHRFPHWGHGFRDGFHTVFSSGLQIAGDGAGKRAKTWEPCANRVETVGLQCFASETVGQAEESLNILQRIFFNGGFRRLAVCGHGFWDTVSPMRSCFWLPFWAPSAGGRFVYILARPGRSVRGVFVCTTRLVPYSA